MRKAVLGALLAALPVLSRAYTGPLVDASLYPSTVYIELDRGSATTQRCTAVVIGPRSVLTAAHCLGEFHDGRWGCILRGVSVAVTAAGRGEQRRLLRGAYVHSSVRSETKEWWNFFPSPEYEGLSDLAVLVFDADLGLPVASLADSVNERQAIRVGGYGQAEIDAREYSKGLRMGEHAVAGLGAAQFAIPSLAQGRFLLHGDSGGPVYDLAGRVVGINSWIRPDRIEVVPNPGGRDYNRVVSYRSNASRTDVARSWIAAASAGPANPIACPFRREP